MKWLRRWQEFVWWVPLLALMSLAGWAALGNVTDRSDLVRWLLELPVQTGYALAALGVAFLARRRQRKKLTPEEADDLWQRLLNGQRGALAVYLTDAAVWGLSFALSLLFFWPSK